jgi:hypothetical protein
MYFFAFTFVPSFGTNTFSVPLSYSALISSSAISSPTKKLLAQVPKNLSRFT